MEKELYEFKKTEDDDTVKGRKPDNGYEPIDYLPVMKESSTEAAAKKSNSVLLAAVVVLAVCLLAGAAFFLRSKLIGAGSIDPESIVTLDRDINFSQVDSLETSAVDVLIKLENTSDQPIKSINYKILCNGDYFVNRMDDSNLFYAYGQIEPGDTGYMYSQIYVPEDTERKQGEIIIDSVEKGNDLGDYSIPKGKVTEFDEITDTYDVYILNPNDDDVNLRKSVVIAVAEDADSLAGAWGCSTQEDLHYDFIEAKKDANLKAAIHDPGFSVPISDRTYTAFIIEKEVIDVD